jgi:hypothetical protein
MNVDTRGTYISPTSFRYKFYTPFVPKRRFSTLKIWEAFFGIFNSTKVEEIGAFKYNISYLWCAFD